MHTQAEITPSALPAHETKPVRTLNLAIVLGGTISAQRKAEAISGTKPRIDITELEARLDIPVYGFDWLEQTTHTNRLTNLLIKIYQNKSNWLALYTFFFLPDIDVIYATGEDVGVPLAILLRLTGKQRPLLIMRLEQPTYGRTRLRHWIYRTYYRFAMQRIDLTMCRTQSHVQLLKSWGAAANKLTFVPETTDTRFFNPETASIDTDSFQLPAKPYIVSAGLELRDYDTLITAVEGLPIQVVIGAGSPWSKFQYARESGLLPANVRVSRFTPRQMRELYRFAELVVVPVKQTKRACGMNVVLEAWAMQKPVIASRTEGLLSYIDDRQTGLFAEPASAADLREKILYALSHPEEAQKWGLNGQRHVTSELNLEQYLHEVETAVTNLMRQA